MSSSPDLAPVRFPHLTGAGDLRTGTWTRHGSGTVTGDDVTEKLLADLAERAKAAASAQGYAQGWAQGMRDAAEQAAAVAAAVAADAEAQAQSAHAAQARAAQALVDAATEVRGATEVCVDQVAQSAIAVAFDLVETILGRELATATDPGADAIARVLRLADGQKLLTLRLPPADLARLDPETLDALTRAGTEVLPDPALSTGDAVADTGDAVLDATVTSAVHRLRKAWS